MRKKSIGKTGSNRAEKQTKKLLYYAIIQKQEKGYPIEGFILWAQEKRQKNKKEVYSLVSDKESVKDYKQFILELVGSCVRMQKFQRLATEE